MADLGRSLITRHRPLPLARSLLPQTGLAQSLCATRSHHSPHRATATTLEPVPTPPSVLASSRLIQDFGVQFHVSVFVPARVHVVRLFRTFRVELNDPVEVCELR